MKYERPTLTSDKAHAMAVVRTPGPKNKKEMRALEKAVEDYLCARVKECGLDIRKLNPQTCKGIPDRLIFDPLGRYAPVFAELKRDFAAKASPLQLYMAKGLATVFVHSKEEAEELLWLHFTRLYKPRVKREAAGNVRHS